MKKIFIVLSAFCIPIGLSAKHVSALTAFYLNEGDKREEELAEKIEYIERRWVAINQRRNPEKMFPPRFFSENDYLSPNFEEYVEELYNLFQDTNAVIKEFNL